MSLVYFMRRSDGVGPVKIGCTKFPVTRLATQQLWSPEPLEIVATAPGIAASDAAPLSELAEALAALMKAHGPKARLDALPALKDASEALSGYILSLENWRRAA